LHRTALAALLLTSLGATALARDVAPPTPAAIEEAKKHFLKGQELYNAGNAQGAVEEFKQAYKLSRNALLLYNVAFVYDGLQDSAMALHYYTKFLTDSPDNERTQQNRELAAERVKLLKQAVEAEEAPATAPPPVEPAKPVKETPAPPPPKKEEPPAKSKVKEFTHSAVEEAPPGLPLDVVAEIPDRAEWRLTLFFRKADQDEFQSTKMKPRYTEHVGRIPADLMAGSSVHYYIEVKDSSGKPVASSGRASSPNIVFVEPNAKPQYYRDEDSESDAKPAPIAKSSKAIPSASADIQEPEDEENPIEEVMGRSTKTRKIDWPKWIATGGAAASWVTFTVLWVTAKNWSDTLEEGANRSRTDGCAVKPCRPFDSELKNIESGGKNYELATNITLGVAVISTAAAGYIWYRELKKARRVEERPVVSAPVPTSLRLVGAGPVLHPQFVGGAAVFSF
jgi:hypothetical protein